LKLRSPSNEKGQTVDREKLLPSHGYLNEVNSGEGRCNRVNILIAGLVERRLLKVG